MPKITRALVSVTDKKGITDFVRELASFGVEIISTGGTAKTLKDSGVTVVDISEYTGFPEMMDGRVKTLHPVIHAGLLARRGRQLFHGPCRQFGAELVVKGFLHLGYEVSVQLGQVLGGEPLHPGGIR